MCGIAGILTAPGSRDERALAEQADTMAARLVHRGPDDAGTWADAAAGIALGHRRLAVIDTSRHGRQPMISADGRYVLVYNGEIYNFPQLRADLAARGEETVGGVSDTAVLLTAIQHFGLERALPRLVGMFAFALWDRRERQLHLVRDRIGQKPLYYGWNGGAFLFMSELKALTDADARPAVDEGALNLFLRYGYVPGPATIYQGFYKLPPGAHLTIGAGGLATRHAAVSVWWSVADAAEAGRAHPIDKADDAVEALHDALRESVRARLVADVPLGMFLSGGIDSSTVASLMQREADRAIKTFSIGFPDERYNEAHYARRVAEFLATEHTELTVTPRDAFDAVTQMGRVYDEPFADPSQVPTYLLCKLTRAHVTVALSGDGGDELLFGYRRYLRSRHAVRGRSALPAPLRRALGATLAQPDVLGAESRRGQRVADLLAPNCLAMYRNRLSKWQHPEHILPTGNCPATCGLDTDIAALDGFPFADAMLLLDQRNSLCDQMMVKVDRASMAASLETRSPLLDHRVVELAWRIPQRCRLREGLSKWPLRRILDRYVPRALTERPKMGFGAPIRDWMVAPQLRDWCETLLSPQELQPHFDPSPIREMWKQTLNGRGRWHGHLWHVLMFQAWRLAQTAAQSPPAAAAAGG